MQRLELLQRLRDENATSRANGAAPDSLAEELRSLFSFRWVLESQHAVCWLGIRRSVGSDHFHFGHNQVSVLARSEYKGIRLVSGLKSERGEGFFYEPFLHFRRFEEILI